MSSSSELIKERLNIADVIGSYIKIEKAGANYKAKCPFHGEKTPSFMVSPGRNSYYCFGCGAKGDIFTFVQEFEKVDFIGALKLLAEKAGVELEQFKGDNASKGEMDRLRSVLERATLFFEGEIKGKSADSIKAKEYLLGRGLTEKMIDEWRIGWAPNEWRLMSDALSKQGVDPLDMETVGLTKKSEKGDGSYDRFRSRVIFPLFDASSRVVGYSGRLFGVPDSEGPKYLNSPDTPLFNKSEVLYGYHKAKDGVRQWKYAILVEGQMDLLMCHQNGFNNAVATSGTSLTLEHLAKIKKLSDNLMIVYDADKAGLKATLRAWTAALSLGMDIKIAALPPGEDPASILLENKDKFKEALKHSKHIIEYHLDMLSREKLDERKLWHAVETEVLPYVAALESAIEKSHFISTISLNTGISEADLREQLNKTKSIVAESAATSHSPTSSTVGGKVQQKKNSIDSVVERLVGIALLEKEKNAELSRRIISTIKEIIPQESHSHIDSLMTEGSDVLVFEAEMLSADATLQKDVDELLFELEERVLKEDFTRYMNQLSIAEKKKEKDQIEILAKKCQEISMKLTKLSQKRNIK